MPGRDEAVAAVVAGAGNDDGVAAQRAQCQRESGDRQAGSFDQRVRRVARERGRLDASTRRRIVQGLRVGEGEDGPHGADSSASAPAERGAAGRRQPPPRR